MDNLYDLLQKIKKRPAMYLGRHSIFSLQAYLDGYYYARRELGVPLTKQESEFQEFLKWIRERFKVETGQLWASILLFHSADERSAVDRFFNLFEEFLNREKSLKEDEKRVETESILS
jgi:Trp operon repressor